MSDGTFIMKKKIVVIEPGYLDYEQEKAILAKHEAEVTALPIGTPIETVLAEIKDADAVMVREALVTKEMLEHMEKCQVVVRYGVGVDNIDLEYAKQKGIYVANVPDYGSEDVAEHAVALLLAATRRLVSRDRVVRQGEWGIGQAEPMTRIGGKVLGIIGFGRIARCFAQKVSGFGFSKVLVSDPMLTEEEAKTLGVVKADLQEICKTSEFISLHAPLNQHTRHMIGAEELAMMKPNAVIVNCGRGGLVDEKALYDALESKQIFAAGTDVFEQEPVARDNPLLSLTNTICTDHTAWFTEESVIELQQKGAQEVLRVFDGGKPKSWVNA